MSTYKGDTPKSIDPRIVSFFENFYAVSDNPSESAHDDYANSVTKDGTLTMGTKKATGFDEILGLRKGWSPFCVVIYLHGCEQLAKSSRDSTT